MNIMLAARVRSTGEANPLRSGKRMRAREAIADGHGTDTEGVHEKPDITIRSSIFGLEIMGGKSHLECC